MRHFPTHLTLERLSVETLEILADAKTSPTKDGGLSEAETRSHRAAGACGLVGAVGPVSNRLIGAMTALVMTVANCEGCKRLGAP